MFTQVSNALIELAECFRVVDDYQAAEEPARTSAATTVSDIERAPLTPGVNYEFWLVAPNFQGEQRESELVTYVAA
ncbi:MAG: hypothetical protein ABI614_19720 [Planctomycetota bacterium]